MKELNPPKVALALGLFFAAVHVIWALLVLVGWAQSLVNFIYGVHMLSVPYEVLAFNYSTAGLLIIVTFGVGYLIGWIFSLVWNGVLNND